MHALKYNVNLFQFTHDFDFANDLSIFSFDTLTGVLYSVFHFISDSVIPFCGAFEHPVLNTPIGFIGCEYPLPEFSLIGNFIGCFCGELFQIGLVGFICWFPIHLLDKIWVMAQPIRTSPKDSLILRMMGSDRNKGGKKEEEQKDDQKGEWKSRWESDEQTNNQRRFSVRAGGIIGGGGASLVSDRGSLRRSLSQIGKSAARGSSAGAVFCLLANETDIQITNQRKRSDSKKE